MGNCDIQSGRFINECSGRSGVKTVFFFRHDLVKNILKNTSGEIIYFGNGSIYRFEQDNEHGFVHQNLVQGNDTSQFVEFKVNMNAFYITPEFLEVLNNIKQGKWAIFYLDYEDNIRMLGELTPLRETESTDASGESADGIKYLLMEFTGIGQEFAPYLRPFDKYPFDLFPVAVYPPYTTFIEKKILINAVDHALINNSGDVLTYG